MNGHEYDINFDARMARKAFIQCHGARTLRGKVFWIDADVIAHAPVPDTFLDEVLPDDKMCCFLGRDGWCYTESGFIGFNPDHQACPTFMAAYLGAFTSGAIFTQPGWHDCHGFDMARRAFDPALFVNLATGLPEGCMHPFVNSVLGRYMDHRKGPRKESRTSREDLLIDRSEAYWRG